MSTNIKSMTITQIKARAPKWSLQLVGQAMAEELSEEPRQGALEALYHAKSSAIARKLQTSDAPKIPEPKGNRVIGRFKSDTGVIVICDVSVIDRKWNSTSPAPMGVYVDGDTEELARLKALIQRYPVEELADGTWCIQRKNITEAKVCARQILTISAQKKLESIRTAVRGRKSGRSIAEDAARATGVGFVNKGSGFVLASRKVLPGEEVTVRVDDHGRAVI